MNFRLYLHGTCDSLPLRIECTGGLHRHEGMADGAECGLARVRW